MGTKAPVFDFAAGDFSFDKFRRITTAEAGEAVGQVIEKAVRTARNKFLIYSGSYGCEAQATLKLDLPREVKIKEIAQDVKEAIIYDYRILRVYDLKVEIQEGDMLVVDYTVDTIFGKVEGGLSV